MDMIRKGRVWKFGDDISTDYLSPSFTLDEPWEVTKKKVLHIHDVFTRECREGDIIVAGENFGCGSSRESAAVNLKRLGIGCVVADSIARIFFRNCMAVGFPVMICKGITEAVAEGEILEVDFESSAIINQTQSKKLTGGRLHPDLLNILKSGGILESLNQ